MARKSPTPGKDNTDPYLQELLDQFEQELDLFFQDFVIPQMKEIDQILGEVALLY